MPKKRWPTRLAPERDHFGTVGEVKSERAGENKSVHPGDIVGIRRCWETGGLSSHISCCKTVGDATMNYGYARVSTREQDLTGQVAELLATGCAEIFKEKASGARGDRAELAKVVKRLEPGDVLVVTRLDRLARSTRDLLNVLASVTERGAGFRSLKDTWCDTTTPHGRLMLTVLGGLAEFERELIRARTGEGRERAKVKSAVRATAQAFPSSAPRSAGAPECRRFGSRCCQHLRSRPGDHLPAASGCRQAGVAA
jgi:hypothetical protein